jgi:proliferating cell nuclear antigen
MFKFSVQDPTTLKDLFTTIGVIQNEATFKITPENINFRMMDASRVAMLNMEIPKTFFDEEYTITEATALTVNIPELLRLLKRGKKGDKTTLELLDNGRLQLCFTGKIERKWDISTLNPEVEECPLPNIKFNTKAVIVTHGLNEGIEDTALVSDHMCLIADNSDKLVFDASGDLMNATITMPNNGESSDIMSLEVAEPSKATYSLSYLQKIVKAASALTDLVTLEFSTDMPLRLDFQDQQCKIEFFLAPRIQVE